jgi:ribonuclease J
MRATIHRGSREIGGTLIELSAGESRILLDAGYPLFLNDKPIADDVAKKSHEELRELGVLPTIPGLYSWDKPGFDGILISHAHPDHYGLLKYVHPDIPVHVSRGTQTIIGISQIFKIADEYPINARLFQMGRRFDVGAFSVKPYLMDHSAFDAAAFEIRACGKTVIYSGDFRGHGRKHVCFGNFIARAAKQADVLFTEGTMVSRNAERTLTESELEMAIVDELRGKAGIALFQPSSQNIDRLVSFFRASKRLGKLFVIDIYTANVLHELRALGNKLPYPSKEYGGIKVFFPSRQNSWVRGRIGDEYASRFSAFHISKQDVEAQQDKILMLAKPPMVNDLERCNLSPGTFFYSMWEGYLEGANQKSFGAWLTGRGFKTLSLHTSGHARVEDIRRLIEGLDPKMVVPIHTMQRESFLGYSEKVALQDDGATFEV